MSEGAVEGGRLELTAVVDTTGLARETQAKVDAATRGVRARIQAEIDAKGLAAKARAAAASASKAAVIKVRADLNTRGLTAETKKAAKAASVHAVVQFRTRLDSSPLVAQVKTAAAAASAAAVIKARTEVDTSQMQAASAAASAAARAAGEGIKVPISGDATGLDGDVDEAIARNKGKDIPIGVSVSPSAGAALMRLSTAPMLVGGVMQLANAVVTLGGGLFSMGAAASQAVGTLAILPNIAGIAAQGIGVIVAGMSGVGDAVSALSETQKQAGAVAVKQADYTASARDQVATATDGVAQAEHSLSLAQWSSERSAIALTRAQRSLTEARRAAKERIEDLNLALKGSVLDEEAAALAIERARNRLADVNYDPTSSDLERREAALALKQAEQNQAEIKERTQDLAAETKKANKEGVKGSQSVKDAEDAVVVAKHNRKEAAYQLAQAEKAVTTAQKAQKKAQDELRSSAAPLAVAQQTLADQLAGLSPAAIKFAQFLVSKVIPRLKEFRGAIQAAILPPMETAITAALPLLDTLQEGFVETAEIMGRGAVRLGEYLGSGVFRKDAATIMESNNRALSSFGDAGMNLVKIFQHLAVAAGPMLERFAEWTATLTDGWLASTKAGRETGKLQAFFERAGDRAAQLGDIISNLVGAIFNLGKGATPAGDTLLDMFERVTQKWQDFTGSVEGQERIREVFDAMIPAFVEIGRLLANLGSLFVSMNEAGGGSLTGLLTVLNLVIEGLDALFSSPAGPAVSSILTLAGAAGGLGLVAGYILKMGRNLKTLAKVATFGKGGSLATKIFGAPGRIAKGQGVLGRALDTIRLRLMYATDGAKKWIAQQAQMAKTKAAAGLSRLGSAVADVGKKAGAAAVSGAKFVAQKTAMVAMRAATLLAAGAQWALNAAMSANPFVLIGILIAAVIAGLVLLFRHNETFRKVVLGAWGAIKKGVSLYWNYYLKPIFTAFWTILKVIGSWAKWLWSKAIQPALGKIRDLVSAMWLRVLKPYLGAWWAALKAVGSWAKWLWDKALGPAFRKIRDLIVDVWKNRIKGPLEALRDIAGKIGSAFGSAKDAIVAAFKKIRNAIGKPIKFVVDTVYNNGIRKVVNFVADKVGLDKLRLDAVDTSKWDFTAAKGGVVPGYTRTKKDTVSAGLRPGEGVVIPEATEMLGGESGIAAINDAAKRGRYGSSPWGPRQRRSATGVGGGGPWGWVKDKASAIGGAFGGGKKVLQDIRRTLSAIGDMGSSPLPKGLGMLATDAVKGVSDWAITKAKGVLFGKQKNDGAGTYNADTLKDLATSQKWIRPVMERVITGTWMSYPGHTGIDLAGPVGSPVYSMGPGRVSASYDIPGYEPRAPHGGLGYKSLGRVVTVSHPGGWQSLYAHLDDRAVKAGDEVKAGTQIGWRGNRGNSTGPHTHVETRPGGRAVDPQAFMRQLGVTFDTGGLFHDGQVAVNRSGKPEAILNNEQWRHVGALIEHIVETDQMPAAAGAPLVGTVDLSGNSAAEAATKYRDLEFALRVLRAGGVHA